MFTFWTATPAVAVLLGGVNHFLWNVFNGVCFLLSGPCLPHIIFLPFPNFFYLTHLL